MQVYWNIWHDYFQADGTISKGAFILDKTPIYVHMTMPQCCLPVVWDWQWGITLVRLIKQVVDYLPWTHLTWPADHQFIRIAQQHNYLHQSIRIAQQHNYLHQFIRIAQQDNHLHQVLILETGNQQKTLFQII